MKFLMTAFILCFASAHAAAIAEKALICGIAKNITPTLHTTITSATALGELFEDYRILIYENDSIDQTPQLLQAWATTNDKVVIRSETISSSPPHSLYERIEAIARARNRVLDMVVSSEYNDYRYVIWADLDFIEPWDIHTIAETILHPQEEWDAVFANGAYDLFAFRDPEFPLGFEVLGNYYWHAIHQIRSQFHLHPDKWRKVYSAFGGLGIYKKEAIEGCRYSAVITSALEHSILNWLHLPQSAQMIWLSEAPGIHPPFTCEHINFHAQMATQGHNKLFINPHLISNHP